MEKNEHLDRLKKHKESLLKSFDNLIDITQKDINKKEKKNDKSEEEEEISLKDEKIKTYAEGILKSHQTIGELISMINKIDIEIKNIENPEGVKKQVVDKSGNSNLNGHLK